VVQGAADEGNVTSPATPLSCLACHERVAHLRGVYTRCDTRHKKAVKSGATTWPALVAAGLALPARPAGLGRRRGS
jgi:hypothetical protein